MKWSALAVFLLASGCSIFNDATPATTTKQTPKDENAQVNANVDAAERHALAQTIRVKLEAVASVKLLEADILELLTKIVGEIEGEALSIDQARSVADVMSRVIDWASTTQAAGDQTQAAQATAAKLAEDKSAQLTVLLRDIEALIGRTGDGTNVQGELRALVQKLRNGQQQLSVQLLEAQGLTHQGKVLSSLRLASIAPLPIGAESRLSVVGLYGDSPGLERDLTSFARFASADTQVATVSNEPGTYALISAKGVGATQITASLGSVSTSQLATTTSAKLIGLRLTGDSTPFAAGWNGRLLEAIGTYSDGTSANVNGSVAWYSSDESIVKLGKADNGLGLPVGEAFGLRAGSVTVSVSLDSISASLPLDLLPATQVSVHIGPSGGEDHAACQLFSPSQSISKSDDHGRPIFIGDSVYAGAFYFTSTCAYTYDADISIREQIEAGAQPKLRPIRATEFEAIGAGEVNLIASSGTMTSLVHKVQITPIEIVAISLMGSEFDVSPPYCGGFQVDPHGDMSPPVRLEAYTLTNNCMVDTLVLETSMLAISPRVPSTLNAAVVENDGVLFLEGDAGAVELKLTYANLVTTKRLNLAAIVNNGDGPSASDGGNGDSGSAGDGGSADSLDPDSNGGNGIEGPADAGYPVDGGENSPDNNFGEINKIIDKNCGGSNCHGAETPHTQYVERSSSVKKDVEAIRKMVIIDKMPPKGSNAMPPQEKAKLLEYLKSL